MILYIAEKPSVALAIATELGTPTRGKGYHQVGNDCVTWCIGHILEQAEPDEYLPDDVPRNGAGKKIWRTEDLPIIPENWILKPKEKMKEQLAIIGQLLKKCDSIVHAGDPDREGQALVDAVLSYHGCTKPVKRYLAAATDSVTVQRALKALEDNDNYKGWADAALARAQADWLIGMNLSRAFTLRAKRGGGQVVISIGRVQTPTLALVVQRDREIAAFRSIDHFKLLVEFQHPEGNFYAGWMINKDTQEGLDADGRLISKPVVDALAKAVNGSEGVISSQSQTQEKKYHPRTFSLSGLTLVASRKYGYTAAQVLEACQSLYDSKITTYPRTDTDYLPEVQHADAPRVLSALKKMLPEYAKLIDAADPKIKSKTWNDKKVSAHHGIIPTSHNGDLSTLSPVERNIYNLVLRGYLAQFFPLHEYLRSEIVVDCAGEKFGVTGNTVTRKGWKVVYGDLEEESQEENDSEQALPPVKKGESVKCIDSEVKALKTEPPSRFTEGTLIDAMKSIHKYITDPTYTKILKEEDGIGTEATRSKIIEELKKRNFLQPDGKAIVSTTIGQGLIDILPEMVKSPVLTALHERMLKQIANKSGSFDEFMRKQEAFIREQVAKANDGAVTMAGASGPSCPKCKEGSLRRFPRKVEGFFWSCSRYQEGCDATFDDKNGKPVPRVPVVISQVHKCLKCKKGLIRRLGVKRPGKPAAPWWSCSGYPDCKERYQDIKGKPKFS